MQEERVEGVVLRSIQYKDHHRIVTLFTKQEGMVSLLVKRVTSPAKMNLLSPFSQIEAVYQKKNSDLFHFKDGTLLSDHRYLRDKWSLLESAGKIGALLLKSQLPGKPAPLLYDLTIACFKQLPQFEESAAPLLLFYLKFLTHEGVVAWAESASFPYPVSREEWNDLKEIAHCRTFPSLQKKKAVSPLLISLEKNLKDLV